MYMYYVSSNTNCLQQVHRAKKIWRNAFSTSVTVRSSGMLPSGERYSVYIHVHVYVRHSLQVSITTATHSNMDCKALHQTIVALCRCCKYSMLKLSTLYVYIHVYRSGKEIS